MRMKYFIGVDLGLKGDVTVVVVVNRDVLNGEFVVRSIEQFGSGELTSDMLKDYENV